MSWIHLPIAPPLQEGLRQRRIELERLEAAMACAKRHPWLWALRWRVQAIVRLFCGKD